MKVTKRRTNPIDRALRKQLAEVRKEAAKAKRKLRTVKKRATKARRLLKPRKRRPSF